jgi:hypothetical protein
MQKAVVDFLFGLCFGMGFLVAYAMLRFIVYILSGATGPAFLK